MVPNCVGMPMDDQQDDDHGDDLSNATRVMLAQGLEPAARSSFRIVEQMLQPSVEEQHGDQHDDHDSAH